MELLMDNLKAALMGKNAGHGQTEEEMERKAGMKDLLVMAAKAAAILAVSFITARVSFFYVMYPCGAALLTALMARGRGGVYAMPPILLGLFTAEGMSQAAVGDLITVVACGLLFFILKSRELSLTARALMASGICVVGKTGASVAFHSFYRYDGFSVLGEGILVLFFVFFFSGFFVLLEKENPVQPVSANIFILVISGLLLAGGLLPEQVGDVSPLGAAALFLVLLAGYRLGVMEGATAGVAAGLMLFGAANQGPAIMGILACGGMAAGLLRGDRKIYAATCFSAVCLSFGFLKGYPNLYMSVYEPVLASLAMILMPGWILEKADKILAKAGRDDAYYELLEKNRILAALDEYRETFSYLALVYGPGKDGKRIPQRMRGERGRADGGSSCSSGISGAAGTSGTGGISGAADVSGSSGISGREARSGRCVASYQFAGMACAVDGMMSQLKQVERPILIKEERFKVELGRSGYARCQGVSGDSVLCNHIRKGEYLIALSDGMGKGQKAAEESTLTLNTLYNLMRAGFEPELALRMINSLLLMKSTEEIFSTVDMGLLNLYNGRLRLFKIGAAATYIKRGDRVEAIKASSLPLGMVEKITVDSIEVSLRKKDQIIIVSDGITEADRGREAGSSERGDWLKETIAGIKSTDPQTVSDLILNRAVERCGLKEKDDMTVITACIG